MNAMLFNIIRLVHGTVRSIVCWLVWFIFIFIIIFFDSIQHMVYGPDHSYLCTKPPKQNPNQASIDSCFDVDFVFYDHIAFFSDLIFFCGYLAIHISFRLIPSRSLTCLHTLPMYHFWLFRRCLN